ncbi:C2H2-type domain-containing protein [Phanerochaete sordida]|uniref:C2H2-type domain-containing protein n=1 Tax=Phanerochaete sordida TaxID=48140 RepID=A0A9P3L8C4_9APHY|nr:C2H2-type domain-containing protein [Phanerochaete sordida]
MDRSEADGSSAPSSLKRTRDVSQDDSDDDNVSLVSRSPSPPPRPEAMDVDKYDEYVPRPEREVVTVETKIGSTNRGFTMLAKLGWVEGQPLGLSGEGRVDPVPFVLKNDFTGLGKANQDVKMIESTVSQRRELDSERQTRETEEQRRVREESVAKRDAVKTEISNVLRAFYCELCDKQFQTVGQYDEHTNSYAHHHKARFRDMQAAQKASFANQDDIDKRKEKERKREEKELRKIAKAAGIKMAKPTASAAVPPPAAPPLNAPDEGTPSASKAGWGSIAAQPAEPAPAAGGARPGWGPVNPAGDPTRTTSSGWATVNPAADPPRTTSGSSGRAQASSAPAEGMRRPPDAPTPAQSHSAPTFRAGGWATLDGSASVSAPPPPQPPVSERAPPPPSSNPPPPAPAKSGWSTVGAAAPAAGTGGWAPAPRPAPQPPAPATQSTPAQNPSQGAKQQETSRSGWQQFKAGAGSSRRRK